MILTICINRRMEQWSLILIAQTILHLILRLSAISLMLFHPWSYAFIQNVLQVIYLVLIDVIVGLN